MTAVNLARVRWRIGQVLTPPHFRALEASLSAESFVHGAVAGLPAYGLGRLVWNGAAPKGSLTVSGVTWVTEDGVLLDAPANARIVGPLDLEAVKRPEVDVYLHAIAEVSDDELSVAEPAAPRTIPRVMRRLQLSADWQVEGSEARVLLARMKKQADKTWALSGDVIPPLLSVGATPYLTAPLRELRQSLADLDVRLRYRLLDLHARHKPVRAVQRARIEARKLDASLSDLESGVGLHPYVVYSWLRAFWLELYLRSETVPDDVIPAASIPPYAHDELADCFKAVLDGITERIHREPISPPTETRPFRLVGNQLMTDKLPDEAIVASELYLLIQKPSADAVVSIEGVRLATPERLAYVTQHSIGVEPTRVKESELVAAFGPWIDFYVLNRSDANPEWLEIKNKRAIAFYLQDRFKGVEAALYWRRAPGSTGT